MPAEGRVGYWLTTYSGKQFYPQDPFGDICIEDIAHALSIEPRFGGHLPQPYSVAQHSVLASSIVETFLGGNRSDQKWALLHDASEAYLKDLPLPVKKCVGSAYADLESRVSFAIEKHFHLTGPEPEKIKKADLICLAIERRDLFPASHAHFWALVDDMEKQVVLPDLSIGFLDWRDAKSAFLRRYRSSSVADLFPSASRSSWSAPPSSATRTAGTSG